MSYQPLQIKGGGKQTDATTSMGVKGLDLNNAPQFLDVQNSLQNVNYLIAAQGSLVKRKGYEVKATASGATSVTMLEKFTDDIYIVGYGTTVASYTKSTGVLATIKSDFSVNTGFNGAKYGEYFFVVNGVEELYRIDSTLAETAVAGSPIAKVVEAIGPRLYLGNLSTDETAVAYPELDDGTNPPFTTWTVGTLATDPGEVSYRNGGPVRAIESQGKAIVVFQDDGKFAFFHDTIDSAGTLTKVDQTQMYRQDFGGARGAISTPKGLFYANEAGLWVLVGIGQENFPISDQEFPTSINLGNTYFNDIDFTNASITYDAKRDNILLSCAKNSDTNNLVIVYNVDNKSFSTITGWNVNRFMNDNQVIYSASSVDGKVNQLFKGDSDNGLNIGTTYEQELNLGALETRQMLKGCYVQGFLSPSSEITVRFDIYDVTGKPIKNKLRYTWSTQYNLNGADGYNSAHYNESTWGGDSDLAGLVESFDGCRPFIRNFQRIRIRLTSGDQLPHAVTWVKLDARIKAKIRRRKMTLLST